MNKQKVISIFSKISEIKKNIGLQIIDAHVHPLDVMGVVHYSDVKNELEKSDYLSPGILEKLNYGKTAQIGSRLYTEFNPEDVNKMIKMAYERVVEKRILDEMDASLVDSVVMLPIAPWLPTEIVQQKFSSQRLISLATIDIHNLKLSEIEGYLKKTLEEKKIKGIKLHPNLQNFKPQPSQNLPELAEKLHIIYKFVEREKLYLLLHGGTSFYTDSVDKKYSGNILRSKKNGLLENFCGGSGKSELFENYKMPIVIAHLGHYGITSPNYALIKTIVKKFNNVYFDTAGVSPIFLKNVLNLISSQRIIFGSDALYNRMAYNLAFAYVAAKNAKNGEKKEDIVSNIFQKNIFSIISR